MSLPPQPQPTEGPAKAFTPGPLLKVEFHGHGFWIQTPPDKAGFSRNVACEIDNEADADLFIASHDLLALAQSISVIPCHCRSAGNCLPCRARELIARITPTEVPRESHA